MAEQNNHINFSLADIERYLQGRMLPKEMHDLEKAALQDPFLADAIEGYSHASSEVSNKHLNAIAAALQATEESKVVPIVHKSTIQWWKVAAIVIVIVGAGSASWLFLQQHNAPKNEIAQTQQKVTPPLPKLQQDQPTSNLDTIWAASGNSSNASTVKKGNTRSEIALPKANAPIAGLTSDNINESKETQAYKQMSPQTDSGNELAKTFTLQDSVTQQNMANAEAKMATAYQYNIAAENAASKKSESYNNMKQRQSLAKSAPSAVLASPSPTYAAPVNSFQLKGRVLSSNAQPVSSALVKVVNGNAATITDDQGYFTLYAPDSTSLVNVSSAGFVAKESNLRNGTPNTIALKEDESSLSEVVVMELNSRKTAKDKAINADAKGKEPYPEKGWPSFQEYVYTKLHKEHEYDSTYAGTVLGGSGRSVELEFMVDANGKPYNFKVVHSVDEVSDKKAIEIVKQGPRWIATDKKGKKAKVTIKL